MGDHMNVRTIPLIAVALLGFAAAGCGGSGSTADLGPTCDGATSVVCDNRCTDIATDSQNCGVCGNACDLDHTCVAAQCVVRCATGFASCDGKVCIDVTSDHKNCGMCN